MLPEDRGGWVGQSTFEEFKARVVDQLSMNTQAIRDNTVALESMKNSIIEDIRRRLGLLERDVAVVNVKAAAIAFVVGTLVAAVAQSLIIHWQR